VVTRLRGGCGHGIPKLFACLFFIICSFLIENQSTKISVPCLIFTKTGLADFD
jgi:hypothetical protein